MIEKVYCLYVKCPSLLSDFNQNGNFSIDFRKKKKHKSQISRTFFRWEPSCSKRTDGRADRHDEADSRFSQFC